MEIVLSILIATIPQRKQELESLMTSLNKQKNKFVEIIIDGDTGYNIGVKRNKLLQQAQGKYIVFIDDDDHISDNYVHEILKACKTNPDCIGISGFMTTNGGNKRKWHISRRFGKWFFSGGIYYRTPNHISPVKREIALQVGFPNIPFGEDMEYSKRILPLLKTEAIVQGDLYHYDYKEKEKGMKSQNKEALIVSNYFRGKKGTVLDIGANDGITFSNSYDLIKSGWSGVLIEPGNEFTKLSELYEGNENVSIYNVGIGKENKIVKFYQSGAHIKNGNDSGLVSTVNKSETERWKQNGVEFTEQKIKLVTFDWLLKKHSTFDFITIDAEGNDWDILQQIDFNKVGCKCLCIEWNMSADLQAKYFNYVKGYGFREIHRNRENLIFAK